MPQPHPQTNYLSIRRKQGGGGRRNILKSAAQAELNHCSHFFLPDSREHIRIEVRERDVIVEITLNLLRFILKCQSFHINNLLVTYFTAKQGTPGLLI